MTESDGPLVRLPTRYRVIEMLGTGRSATVWLARDTRTGRQVAAKEIHVIGAPSDPERDDWIVERFEREVRSLGRLAGIPGVCQMLEVGVDRARIPWVISEYMSGGSLSAHEGYLDRSDCADLFGALAAAHERGVVHGDLSPGNILLDASGRPVLGDFGMARLGPGAVRRGADGMTPAYAAPERLKGGGATPGSDVYALAASLSGRIPDSDRRTRSTMAAAMRTRPDRRPSAARVVRRLRGKALGSRS